MLLCFSKALNHIVYNFLADVKILLENQFGFEATHSKEHSILQLTSQIADSFNSGQFTLVIFIDY